MMATHFRYTLLVVTLPLLCNTFFPTNTHGFQSSHQPQPQRSCQTMPNQHCNRFRSSSIITTSTMMTDMKRQGYTKKKSINSSTVSEIEAESIKLCEEIQELKSEARRRLEELNKNILNLSSSSSSSSSSLLFNSTTTAFTLNEAGSEASPSSSSSSSSSLSVNVNKKMNESEEKNIHEYANETSKRLRVSPSSPIEFPSSATKDKFHDSKLLSSSSSSKLSHTRSKGIPTNLLDGTQWKISLNIGREPGTWMPSTWGKSESRIHVSFLLEFTSSQLYDRDDFLRGNYNNNIVMGCQVLHVVNNEATLGPTVSKGSRCYPVRDGGWRIVPGQGPMGTDLLRFYVEFDERIAHLDGDVDIPRGRVYCSCGYFPFVHNGKEEDGGGGGGGSVESTKNKLTKDLIALETQIVELQLQRGKITNPFSLDRIKLTRDMFQLNQQVKMLRTELMIASVREPDRQLLRFTKDGDVGLTKEGGVCIQVNKGLAVEYHILGRFSVASVADK